MKRCPELVRKECRACLKLKLISCFPLNGYRRKDGTSATRNDCKKCNKKIHDEYVERNRVHLNKYVKERYRIYDRDRVRDYGLKKMYGITTTDYEALLKKQNDRCAICQLPQSEFSRRFDVDHCHETKKIRGLCCIRCNRGIGLLKDDIEILQRAVRYLKKNKI